MATINVGEQQFEKLIIESPIVFVDFWALDGHVLWSLGGSRRWQAGWWHLAHVAGSPEAHEPRGQCIAVGYLRKVRVERVEARAIGGAKVWHGAAV